ncbi:cytochrome C [Halalkalibacillus sediminis]|uniref:Cytochrome C n=1 Tax=Halalkalibacillus sediminis TaxID=2018042 RepID=A0A2I0QXG9_9BACI|nr:cytochrome c [Halalkalibacillus sediminis]PKR79015.1 cytochrome C [Halalkalibacillus sediminis]
MKKNAVIPFALIALLGIVAMVVMSGVGLSQMDQAEGNESEDTEESMEPEDIYQANCMQCHGENLEGGTGPNLQDVGDRYSLEKVQDIIANGVEGSNIMTGDYATNEEAEILAAWLVEGESGGEGEESEE